MAGLGIALMTYALAERLGCGFAVSTATRLNKSAAILRRIGGSCFANLPGYYEPKFASVMEIIQFKMPCLNKLYASRLNALRDLMNHVRIVCGCPPAVDYAHTG